MCWDTAADNPGLCGTFPLISNNTIVASAIRGIYEPPLPLAQTQPLAQVVLGAEPAATASYSAHRNWRCEATPFFYSGALLLDAAAVAVVASEQV